MKALDDEGLYYTIDRIYDLINAGSGADYIVEQGTSGIWTYRKWASGIAECWCNKTYSVVNCDGVWGSLNTGNQNPSYETYPSGLFISAPNCQISWDANNGSYNFWIGSRNEAGEGTKDRTPSWQYVRPAGGNVGGTFFYYARGLWKTFNPSAVKSASLDTYYPVGSIYMSVNNVNPANLFGGTWEQIKDKFLLSAGDTYSAGGTGGEATHTLTTEEIPSHNHPQTTGANNGGVANQIHYYNSGNYDGAGFTIPNWMTSHELISTRYTGGGGAHNNMPPYLTVYMWKRTA